jgi:hypothetical protein
MMKELRGYVMLMMMRAAKDSVHNAASTWATIPVGYNFTDKEIKFINAIGKDYQFTDGWYKLGQIDIGVRILQYVLKAKGYYAGELNGINTKETVNALYQFQTENMLISGPADTAAGYMWPNTRTLINAFLRELLNPGLY